MTLNLDVTARPQVSALIGQVKRDDGAHGFGRAHPAFGLFAGRIAAYQPQRAVPAVSRARAGVSAASEPSVMRRFWLPILYW